MKKVVKAAVKRGWKHMAKSGNHYMLQWKDGTRVTASLTPSDHHATANAAADFKRVERDYLDSGPAKPYTHDK